MGGCPLRLGKGTVLETLFEVDFVPMLSGADIDPTRGIRQNGLFPAVSCVLHQGPVQGNDPGGVVS